MTTRTAVARHITPTVAVVLVAGVLVVGALVAPAHGHGVRQRDDDPRAVALLYRAMAAPDRVSYAGTQYVGAWSALDLATSTSAVVQVRHTAGGTTVVTAHDDQQVMPLGRGESWLAGDGGPIGLVVKAYDVQVVGQGRVAGRPVDIVGARRSDGSLAARLWLDAEHALALRRETYDEAGRTVSASAFVEIDFVPALSRFVGSSSRRATMAGLSATPAPLSHTDLASLRAAGWTCLPELGGDLMLYEATRHGDAVQLSYSDGVTTVSVFEQPGQLDPATLEGFTPRDHGDGIVYTAPGPPSQFVWATDDERVITVVADGTVHPVDAALAAYPPSGATPPGGLLHRIGRGAKKLVSWLNPFD